MYAQMIASSDRKQRSISMSKLTIRIGSVNDLELMNRHEHHITPGILRTCLSQGRMLIAELDGNFAGWLRWNLFWDSIPFMNLLYIPDGYRCRGIGSALTGHWEKMMNEQGHNRVMTSSQQDEYAQHFYVKLGYRAIGSFIPHGDPLEIIFEKCFD